MLWVAFVWLRKVEMVGVWVELLHLIVEACKCLEKAGVDVDCKIIVCVWNWMVSINN